MVQTASIVFNPPAMLEGKQRWSIIKLFGSSLKEECKIATKCQIFIDITHNDTSNPYTLTPTPEKTIKKKVLDETRIFAAYDVKRILGNNKNLNISRFNIASTSKKEHEYQTLVSPPISASRFITGYGLTSGGITCRIENNSGEKFRIVYLDIIPWYLRMYLHTLKVQNDKEVNLNYEKLFYKPAKDRNQPHHLEIILNLPSHSITTISYQFDRAFLKWTEYPPDVNHGVYAVSSIITFQLKQARNITVLPTVTLDLTKDYLVRLRTESLLVSLATPDFSMPYDVICLVSTLVSLAFGPIHNLTTKVARLASSEQKESLMHRLKRLIKRTPTGQTSK